jgi:signal transduction histidine kinase/ActR/RegA family two-component response regulator
MRGIPLRRRVFALAAAGILPLALTAGVGLYAIRRQQNAQAERVGVELARSVATAVYAELRTSISVLETLATSLTLDTDDLVGFRDRAQRVIVPRSEWAAILLTDPAGTPLIDTRAAVGSPLLPIAERESFDRVVRTRLPAVGDMTLHAQKEWLFAVRVPVIRNGTVRYILTALVRPATIRDMVNRQQVPEDWVISIIDGHGLRVARSRAHDENLGGRLSESVQRVVDTGNPNEGFGLAYTLEGDRIFTPYSRLPSSGWVAVLGIPTSLVDAAAYRSLAAYAGGVLLSIGLAIVAALWVARSITRPIDELGAAAVALGRRQTPKPLATSIQEIREVGAVLETAAEELARSEAQREDLLQKERQARETAERADRAKDEFMAVLSHELRTPLNAVYGWARLLQSGHIRDAPMIARATDAIVRNTDVQVQLIDDLLDTSRITSGKMRLDVRQVDLQPVIHGALDAVRPAADAKGVRIVTALDAGAGIVAGDPSRIQQIIWNLLMNAVKFTPRGGDVRLELRRANAHAQVVVTDTGQGIAPRLLPHVFERFRQADSSSTRQHGGLGLGLALVKHLTELHGGSVAAESDGENHGATFTVTLPLAPAHFLEQLPMRETANAPGAVAHSTFARLDGVRILVVDDDREGAGLAETILKGAGAEVRTCQSAMEALELVTAWRPDVLVSDIEMPGEDGYSLIRKIRALTAEAGGTIPAIALTAYGRPQDRVRSLAAGFNEYVAKPVNPAELTGIVAGVTGTSDGSARPTIAS